MIKSKLYVLYIGAQVFLVFAIL